MIISSFFNNLLRKAESNLSSNSFNLIDIFNPVSVFGQRNFSSQPEQSSYKSVEAKERIGYLGVRWKAVNDNPDSLVWSLYNKAKELEGKNFKSLSDAFKFKRGWSEGVEYLLSSHVFIVDSAITKLNIIFSGDDPSFNRRVLVFATSRFISMTFSKFKEINLSEEQSKAIREDVEFLYEKLDFSTKLSQKLSASHFAPAKKGGGVGINFNNLESFPPYDPSKVGPQHASSIPYFLPLSEIDKVGGIQLLKQYNFNKDLRVEEIEGAYLKRWADREEFPVWFALKSKENSWYSALLKVRRENSELYATHLPTKELDEKTFAELLSSYSENILNT